MSPKNDPKKAKQPTSRPAAHQGDASDEEVTEERGFGLYEDDRQVEAEGGNQPFRPIPIDPPQWAVAEPRARPWDSLLEQGDPTEIAVERVIPSSF